MIYQRHIPGDELFVAQLEALPHVAIAPLARQQRLDHAQAQELALVPGLLDPCAQDLGVELLRAF